MLVKPVTLESADSLVSLPAYYLWLGYSAALWNIKSGMQLWLRSQSHWLQETLEETQEVLGREEWEEHRALILTQMKFLYFLIHLGKKGKALNCLPQIIFPQNWENVKKITRISEFK